MTQITPALIRSAAQGQQQAVAALYELSYNSVYRTVRSMIRNEDTALDVLQDSYVKAFKNLNKLDSAESFLPWLKRIAANTARDYLKKKKPILFSETADEEGHEADWQDDRPDHLPEEVIDRSETARLIGEILAGLSDEQRLAVGLFYYEQLSVKEIAALLDCSENTVKSRLNYARKKIEAQVRRLEAEGTKLYSMAPVGFLMWLFGQEAAAAVPSAPVLGNITAGLGMAGAAGAAGSAAKGGLKAAVKNLLQNGLKSAAAKAGAAVTAAAVTVGGAAIAISALSADYDYAPLLEMYEEAAEDDFARWKAQPEDYPALSARAMDYAQFSTTRSTVYTLYDLDGNGKDELLIASYSPLNGALFIRAVYTTDGRKAIPIVQEHGEEHMTVTDNGYILVFSPIEEGVGRYNVIRLDSEKHGMTHTDIYTLNLNTRRFSRGGESMDIDEFYSRVGSNLGIKLEWSVLIPSLDPVYRFAGPIVPAENRESSESSYLAFADEEGFSTADGFGHPRDLNGDMVYELLIFDSAGIREVYTLVDNSPRLLWLTNGENTARLYSDGSLLIGGQYFRLQNGSLVTAQPDPKAQPVELSADSCFIMLRTHKDG